MSLNLWASRFYYFIVYLIWIKVWHSWASQVALEVNSPLARAGDIRDVGSVPGLGRSSSGGNGNPLQYSCRENPMERGVWRAQSMGSQRVGHDWMTEHARMHAPTGRDSEVHVHWIGIHKFRGSILLIVSLSAAWAAASRRVRTVYQQHLVSILGCLSGMAFACILLLCSFPSMIYSEWTTPSLVSDQCSRFWTIREVAGTKEGYPPTPGQTGVRRNQMKLFQWTKKWLEHIPHSRKNFDKTNTSCDQNVGTPRCQY